MLLFIPLLVYSLLLFAITLSEFYHVIEEAEEEEEEPGPSGRTIYKQYPSE